MFCFSFHDSLSLSLNLTLVQEINYVHRRRLLPISYRDRPFS